MLKTLKQYAVKIGALSEQSDSNESENTQIVTAKEDSASAILEFMNNYVQKLHFGAEKNFVFILGNTGAGKSTLTSFLTDVNLESVEIRDGSGEFIIVDRSGLISGVSTTNSKTILPELMIDKSNRITYYDCPGFNDSRGVANDISVTYLIQQLIKYARSLKLVFAVSYSSVKVGTGDRRDFMDLAKHAVTFVKNIEKYRSGIALIVTKVENRYVMKNKQLHLVEDCKIIEGIVEFLKQAKLDLENKVKNDQISMEEREFNSQKIRFIDILLETNDRNEYERIRIMRLADESGPVKNIDILQTVKRSIQSMIANNIQYVCKENSDFGYTISDESKNRVHEIMEQMQTFLMNDLKDISKEIKDYYLQQEQHITDLKALKETISSGHQRLSGISATNFKIFTKLIVDAANDLDIGVTYEIFNQIWRHIECIDFITAISKRSLSPLFDSTKSLTDTMQYLDESQKFYQFLIDLHTELSKYEVQKNLSNGNLKELSGRIVGHNMEVNVEALKDFLNQADLNSLVTSIENIQINRFQANALKTVLNHTIQTGPFYLSESKISITVKGYNVKLSDVMKWCSNGIKYFNVFALNNLFIDVDVDRTGQQLQLTLIASKWYVIGDRKIILSGEKRKLHSELKAKDDDGHFMGGGNGNPGLPGGPSGHFMAIADEIINDSCLEVQLNGGKGGTGQNGGNGKDGIEGKNAPKPGFHFFGGNFGGFDSSSTIGGSAIPPFITVNYDIKGKEGRKPSNGGNGGCGGLGGIQGKSFVVVLKQPPKFLIINKKGVVGDPGIGGIGGKGTKNGKIAKTRTLFLFIGTLNIEDKEVDGTKIENAADGRVGAHTQNQCSPSEPNLFTDYNHSEVINNFKNYVRENLANHIQETELRKFLSNLEADKRIQSKYSLLSFVNEWNAMDMQYFELHHKLSFEPLVSSFRMRIDEYGVNQRKDLSQQNNLFVGYLQAVTLSKLCSIQNMSKHISTFDLIEILSLAQEHIYDLNESKRIDIINRNVKNCTESINRKVISVKAGIERNEIIVEEKLTETDEQISKLMDKLIENQLTLVDEEKLNELFIRQRILIRLKFIGQMACWLTNGQILLDSVENQTLSIKPNQTNQSNGINTNLAKIQSISDHLKSCYQTTYLVKIQIFHEKIFNIFTKILRKYFQSNIMKMIKVKIFEINSKIADERAKLESGRPDLNFIIKMQNELHKTVNDEKIELERQNDRKSNLNFTEKIRKLEFVLDTLAFENKLEKNSHDSEAMVQECAVSSTFKRKMKQLEILENNFEKILIDKIHDIQQRIAMMHQDLESKSRTELNKSKSEFKCLFTDVTEYFCKITTNFEVDQNLRYCIDKQNEWITTLISISDRSESYTQKRDFANCIAYCTENEKCTLIYSETRSTFQKLKEIIDKNIILEEYKCALNAFKQHQFPFAPIHTEILELPENLQIDDIEKVKRVAISEIEFMKKAIQSSKTMNEKYVNDVINVNPLKFYTWQNDEIKDDINKLLNGEEIILKADIAKGLNQNAVKFKEIGIYLKLSSKSLQRELDAKLENFRVVMKMVGNSYYRCGKRSYSMSIDENIVISYSFKKDRKSEPTGKNDVYRKISNGRFFLSPYTMWSIKLYGHNFQGMDKFKNKAIDIQLIGNGQYVKSSSLVTTEISPNILDKHYNFDSIIRFPNQNTLINNV